MSILLKICFLAHKYNLAALYSITVCGLSDLPDPRDDDAFNNLASFPTFNDYFGDFDPNNTDDMTDFQKPASNGDNMTRAEMARRLKVVGGVAAQPGEIR